MKRPNQIDLFDALDATWAPFAFHNLDGWVIREGAGGGQRVSAATARPDTQSFQINAADAKMVSLDQTPLFMIRNTDTGLDAELHGLEYEIVDPVVILMAPTTELLSNPPKKMQTVHTLNKPDANAKIIWADGGIDQGRLDVMTRVKGPKAVLGAGEMGVAFAAAHGNVAMIHAVEVASQHRRKGVANAMMYKAFEWAKDLGCEWVAVLTVHANIPARTLYEDLGMTEAAAYHYRRKT